MQSEYGGLTPDIKRKILGLNSARLYGIKVPTTISVSDSGTGPEVTPKPEVEHA
jgi:hypothetical protein